MEMLIMWLVSALVVLVLAYILPGVAVSSFWSALAVAVVLGLVNIFIRPILIFLTLPINILTLGLFTFVVNALMVMLVSAIVPGFKVSGFWWALAFSILFSLIMTLLVGVWR